jgi:hypothetical protein
LFSMIITSLHDSAPDFTVGLLWQRQKNSVTEEKSYDMHLRYKTMLLRLQNRIDVICGADKADKRKKPSRAEV